MQELLQFGVVMAVCVGFLAFCCRGPKNIKERLIVGLIYLLVGFAIGALIWWAVGGFSVIGQWLRR